LGVQVDLDNLKNEKNSRKEERRVRDESGRITASDFETKVLSSGLYGTSGNQMISQLFEELFGTGRIEIQSGDFEKKQKELMALLVTAIQMTWIE
jgi:hypothetical protein